MTYFYGHLFAAEAEIRAMFPAAMDQQRDRFYRALARIARGENQSGQLTRYLVNLGRLHRKFGVRDEHYAAFRQALLATMRRYAADAWDERAVAAWTAAFDAAADIMIEGGRDDAPGWWLAEVIAHEIRAPHLAVFTVRTDQPLRHLPGQHVSMQTPRWPRLWRDYSIANAPRDDGTLTFHVRAVPGGLVSNALVHHVRPGDILLLGQATGPMVADTESGRDVLCLAGGTGLAPVKAIVEAIGRSTAPGRRREIVLYVGARRMADLYDLPALHRMELDYPWLQVIPVTSGERAPETMHGTITDIVAQASWPDRLVYVSGPDPMIASTVRTLLNVGAAPELVSFDPSPESDLTPAG